MRRGAGNLSRLRPSKVVTTLSPYGSGLADGRSHLAGAMMATTASCAAYRSGGASLRSCMP